MIAKAALADGSVNWSTLTAAAITAQTNSTTFSPFIGGGAAGGGAVGNAGGAASLGTGFYFELLYTPFTGAQAFMPTTFAGLSAWNDSGLEATNNPAVAGRLAPMNPNVGATVPWSGTNSIMLVGWSANLGSSYATALNAMENGTFGSNSFFWGISHRLHFTFCC